MSETFFKVTKPDGSPFHGSGIIYEAGKTYRRAQTGKVELCSPSAIHASRTPEQAATFGQWPYVLWEVTGKVQAEQEDKCGFRQLTIVKQLPVHLCFGPNGKAVLRIIQRAESLTPDEGRKLCGAWDAALAAGDAAWDAVLAAGDAAWDAVLAAGDAAWCAALAAGDAAWDAVLATTVADPHPSRCQHGLTQEHIDTLRKPWLDVIGPTWEAPHE